MPHYRCAIAHQMTCHACSVHRATWRACNVHKLTWLICSARQPICHECSAQHTTCRVCSVHLTTSGEVNNGPDTISPGTIPLLGSNTGCQLQTSKSSPPSLNKPDHPFPSKPDYPASPRPSSPSLACLSLVSLTCPNTACPKWARHTVSQEAECLQYSRICTSRCPSRAYLLQGWSYRPQHSLSHNNSRY